MRIKILLSILITLAFFTASYAQTPDKPKLDRLFDRLAEKNKAYGQPDPSSRKGNKIFALNR